MKLNKKAQISNFYTIMTMIIAFGLIIFLFLFFTVGIKQIFSENILEPTINATLTGTQDLINNETINNVNSLQTTYDTNWFNYDIFFLVLVFAFIIELFYIAFQTKISNMFTFFGLITIGNMIFLLILSFASVIREWLILNLYTNLFDLTSINTPIIDYFITNINIISFILFIMTILISVLDWNIIIEKITGIGSSERVEE